MAATESLSNLDSNIKDQSAVLLIQTEYSSSTEESSSLNQHVAEILREHEPDIPVLITVLQATEEDKQQAQQDGVELLLPKLDPDDPRTDPSLNWLTFDHGLKYPHLPSKISTIVGHTGVTSRAAVRIKQERYPDAKVILITNDIPEDTEYYKGDEEAMGIGKKENSILEDAQEADVVFSLGKKTFDHFENQFRGILTGKRPQHLKIVLRSSNIFEHAEAEYKDTETMVVLSIGRVKGVEKLKGYDLAVEALSIVADRMKVKYRVIVDKNDFETSKAILEHCKSANLQITLLPYGTQKDICKEMMQAHLVLMPSRAEPFGLVGLDAIVAGIPVLVSSRSGLADFIHEHVDELHHSIVDMDGRDEHVTIQHWAESIERMLKHIRTEFKTAARCKQQLLSTKYWEESHLQFIKACTDTDKGNDTQNTDEVLKRKRADSVGDTDEDRKVVKLDQKIKLSVRTPESTVLQGEAILLDKLKDMFTRDVQSDAMFNERMERFSHLESEVENVMDDTVSEKRKETILYFINELFTREVLQDHDRFIETMNRLKKLKAKIRKLREGSVLCELRFDHRDSQVEFVTACRDGTLSAILTEEYISQELVQICGGMLLYVHIEVDEADFQKGADFFHDDETPGNHDQSVSTVDQTAALTAEIQQMELQDSPSVKPKDDRQTTEVPLEISELVSLDIRELEQLTGQPRKRTFSVGSKSSGYHTGTPGSGPSRPDSPTGKRHNVETQGMLESLLAELNTPAVLEDKAQQFDLYSQIGDLYRTKLHNLQSALQYYQNMLECAHALSEDTKQAKAYSRLGLTCDILGLQQEAFKNHERALAIYRVETKNESDICVAYKNLASSLALSGQVSDAKTNYESALAVAMETLNKTEQMDIYCMLGDLHREQLHEPQVSYTYYTEMLALAKDLERKDREFTAYNRLGVACGDMQDNEAALEWHQKYLKMSQDDGDKKGQTTAHINVGNAYRRMGKLDLATSHLNTALQMAQQTGDQHGQMKVYYWKGEMHREQLHSPRTAIQYYEQYLALARQLEDRHKEGLAYNKLGTAHYEMGEYEAALEWCQKHLKMSQDDGDKTGQIIAHQNIGDLYKALGKLDLARSHYQSAMTIAMETGNKQEQEDIAKGLAELD
ncbi:uncharacterized protein LOC144865902 [Branchiostoma floridae x Branchiostoma japonicum]